MLYYNARYYDPEMGAFISPDTIVPEPGVLFDYNRYMYVRGNPLRYTDPSGHYSDEALYEHFDCEEQAWSCVESHFEEGGSHAGPWGWLEVLMRAEDGDDAGVMVASIAAGSDMEAHGQFATVDGRIMVRNGQYTLYQDGQMGATFSLGETVHEAGFSSLAFMRPNGQTPDAAAYSLPAHGLGGIGYEQRMADCRHTDCTGRTLNATSTGVAVVGEGCAIATAGACAFVATLAGVAIGSYSTRRTYKQFRQKDASFIDAAVSAGTTAAGAVAPPVYGPVISGAQWAWDEYLPW